MNGAEYSDASQLSWTVVLNTIYSGCTSPISSLHTDAWILSNFSSVTGNPLVYDAITPVFPVAMKVARPLAKKQETPTYPFEHSQPQLHQHRRHLIKPDRRVRSCYGSPVKAEVTRAT